MVAEPLTGEQARSLKIDRTLRDVREQCNYLLSSRKYEADPTGPSRALQLEHLDAQEKRLMVEKESWHVR